MVVEFTDKELKELVMDSYELMLAIPKPKRSGEGKYEIESRSKLKNLPEALREFSDPSSSITHFVKSASYLLPRSKLDDFLDLLLKKVQKIQDSEPEPERVREKIRYLVGYTNWGMDAVCNIFGKSNDDNGTRARLRTMVTTELSILGAADDVDRIVENLVAWKTHDMARRA